MGGILDPIAGFFGKFLYFIYNNVAFHNYGLAIIIFTIVVKLVLLPLTVKQIRSTHKMQEIQPQLQEIQKRYKNDKEKLNAEMMKLYSENKVNPAGGCLPMLIQLPILFSLYYAVIQPLKFMLDKTPGVIFALKNIAGVAVNAFAGEIQVLRNLANDPSKFDASGNVIWQAAAAAGDKGQFIINSAGNIVNQAGDVLVKVGDKLLHSSQLINFKFLGLDLSQIATYDPSKLFGPQMSTYLPLLLLPIIGVITTFYSSKMSMPQTNTNTNNKKSGTPDAASSMSKSMLYMGPLMTLIFSFQLPAGVVLYWIAGYVFQIFQQLYINKFVLKKKEVAVK